MTPAQDKISLLIKAKRRETELGVRASAAEAKISPATMSRLERGISATLPDAETLRKLAEWLGVSLTELLGDGERTSAAPESTTPEIVEVHLRADKNLSPEAAKALAQMFKAIYEQVSTSGIPRK